MSSAQQQASRGTNNGLRAFSWLRALRLIFGAPKKYLPYVLPWVLESLTVAFCYLVVQGVFRQQLLVPPVDTPPSLAERGYTSSFLAEKIMSAMRVIGRDAGSIPHDALTVSDAQPDIQIPGQDLSYATTVRFLKEVVDRKDVVVHIGITKLGDAADSYVAHVQIEGGVFRSRQDEVPFAGRDMDRFVRDIATQAMRLAEPNILASHLFTEVQKTKCSLAQCNYSEIVGIYDEVLALPASKQSEWAEAGKAWLLVSQGLAKEAEAQSREALRRYEGSAILRASLGIALEQQHRIDDALEQLKAGAKESSRTAENLRLLGDVMLHAHRYPEALKAFREADRMQPDSVYTLHDWGEALIAVGRYNDAIAKFSQAVSLRPDLAPSYAGWGRALELNGEITEAARRYAQASKLDKDVLSPHEDRIARLSKEYQEVTRSGTPAPDATSHPRLNPPGRRQLEATQSPIGWTAMLTA
jgi:Tfp pilus assembly protein PilF